MSRIPSTSRWSRGLLSAAVPLAVSASASPAWAGSCNWTDGDDEAAGGLDPGRGRLDANAHKEFALSENAQFAVPIVIADRLQMLFGCLDRAAYAKAYADVSVLTASFGRKYAGWKDGTDAKAPVGDSGRGIASHPTHVNHARGPGGETAHTLFAAA